MSFNFAETVTLQNIIVALEVWGGALRDGEAWARSPALAERVNGLGYRPAVWLGHDPTPAERKAFSRAAVSLERRGLVDRVVWESRVAFLRPTAQGLLVAISLTREPIDVALVRAAIDRANWSTKAHLDALELLEHVA